MSVGAMGSVRRKRDWLAATLLFFVCGPSVIGAVTQSSTATLAIAVPLLLIFLLIWSSLRFSKCNHCQRDAFDGNSLAALTSDTCAWCKRRLTDGEPARRGTSE